MATMQDAVATLAPDDALAIGASIPNVAGVAVEQSAFGVTLQAGSRNESAALFGVSPNFNQLREDRVAAGRFLSVADDRATARVALLGAQVARALFADLDPIGQHLRARGVDLQVVGVLAPNGAGPGGVGMDNLIYIPIRTAARRLFNRTYLSLIQVKLAQATRSEATAAAVSTLLRERHRLAPGQPDDFRVSTPRAMLARMTTVQSSLARSMRWIGGIAFLLGGIMIANLMYAATAARAREIGMRRAMGATRRDVLQQFWTEGVLVAGLAGVVGVVLSLVAVVLGARTMRLELVTPWVALGGGLGAAVLVGLLASLLPARRAALTLPARVLRS
jgi:ABC-type antimicrobial peptide transport system permease subunit